MIRSGSTKMVISQPYIMVFRHAMHHENAESIRYTFICIICRYDMMEEKENVRTEANSFLHCTSFNNLSSDIV